MPSQNQGQIQKIQKRVAGTTKFREGQPGHLPAIYICRYYLLYRELFKNHVTKFHRKRGVHSPLDHPLNLPMKICNIRPSYKLHVPAICVTQRWQAHINCKQVEYYRLPNYTSSKLSGLRISESKFHLP